MSLNDERDNSGTEGNVYGGKMGMREAFHIPKPGNKPIIDVGPSECSLNSLQQEHEISCKSFGLTLQSFPVISKTNLKTLRLVGHLGNCSYKRLNIGEFNKRRLSRRASYKSGHIGRHRVPNLIRGQKAADIVEHISSAE